MFSTAAENKLKVAVLLWRKTTKAVWIVPQLNLQGRQLPRRTSHSSRSKDERFFRTHTLRNFRNSRCTASKNPQVENKAYNHNNPIKGSSWTNNHHRTQTSSPQTALNSWSIVKGATLKKKQIQQNSARRVILKFRWILSWKRATLLETSL